MPKTANVYVVNEKKTVSRDSVRRLSWAEGDRQRARSARKSGLHSLRHNTFSRSLGWQHVCGDFTHKAAIAPGCPCPGDLPLELLYDCSRNNSFFSQPSESRDSQGDAIERVSNAQSEELSDHSQGKVSKDSVELLTARTFKDMGAVQTLKNLFQVHVKDRLGKSSKPTSKTTVDVGKRHFGSQVDSPKQLDVEEPLKGLSNNRSLILAPIESETPVKEKKKECPKPTFLHICFFSLNCIFVVFGLILLGIGSAALSNKASVQRIFRNNTPGRLANIDFGDIIQRASGGLIISGLVFLLLGCLGAVGVALGLNHLLMVYAGIVGAVVGIQLIAVLLAFIYRTSLENSFKEKLLDGLRQHYDGRINSSSLFSQTVDAAQVYFKCCGVNSWRDFENTPWYRTANNLPEPGDDDNSNNSTIIPLIGNQFTTVPETPSNKSAESPIITLIQFPETCCKTVDRDIVGLATGGNLVLEDPDCQKKNASKLNPYTINPCFSAVRKYVLNQVLVLVSMLVTVFGVEISAVTNAVSIARKLVKDRELEAAALEKKQKSEEAKLLKARAKERMKEMSERQSSIRSEKLEQLEVNESRKEKIEKKDKEKKNETAKEKKKETDEKEDNEEEEEDEEEEDEDDEEERKETKEEESNSDDSADSILLDKTL